MSRIHVECQAGYRGEETPRRFRLYGRTVEVVEILERRAEPDARSFRVRGDDGRVYTLRRERRAEGWEIPEIGS